MDWKRIFNTFLEELKVFLRNRAKPKEETLEDICLDVLRKVNRISTVGLTRFKEKVVLEVVSSNLENVYLITGDQKGSNKETGVHRFTKDYFLQKFIRIAAKDRTATNDVHEAFFLYCFKELPDKINRSGTMYETQDVQLIFERYRYTVQTVLNAITESIKYTNTLGNEAMLTKYMEILDTFFNEVESVWSKRAKTANELQGKETEAVFNSLIQNLKFEEEFIRSSSRQNID